MAYDMTVAKTAYDTAKRLGADDKVILSLFEAGIVESGFRNLTASTDHDSVGYLQQRPSQGWPNPTDVVTATTSYIRKAIANEARYGTAGQLAQSVQVSAYPGKYDQSETAARALLAQVAGGPVSATVPGAVDASFGSGLLSLAMPDSVNSFFTDAGKSVTAATWLFKPSNLLRLAAGVSGAACILLGVLFLSREVR